MFVLFLSHSALPSAHSWLSMKPYSCAAVWNARSSSITDSFLLGCARRPQITPVYSSGFELAFVRELLREFSQRVKRWWQFPLCRAAQPPIQKSASFCSTVDAKQKSLLACLRRIGCSLWTVGLRFRAPWTPVLRRKRYVPKIPRRFQKLNPNLWDTLRSNRLIHHPATQFGLGC